MEASRISLQCYESAIRSLFAISEAADIREVGDGGANSYQTGTQADETVFGTNGKVITRPIDDGSLDDGLDVDLAGECDRARKRQEEYVGKNSISGIFPSLLANVNADVAATTSGKMEASSKASETATANSGSWTCLNIKEASNSEKDDVRAGLLLERDAHSRCIIWAFEALKKAAACHVLKTCGIRKSVTTNNNDGEEAKNAISCSEDRQFPKFVRMGGYDCRGRRFDRRHVRPLPPVRIHFTRRIPEDFWPLIGDGDSARRRCVGFFGKRRRFADLDPYDDHLMVWMAWKCDEEIVDAFDKDVVAAYVTGECEPGKKSNWCYWRT